MPRVRRGSPEALTSTRDQWAGATRAPKHHGTFWKNTEKSLVALPLAALFFRAISSMVSWRNLASSSLTRSSFFSLSSCEVKEGALHSLACTPAPHGFPGWHQAEQMLPLLQWEPRRGVHVTPQRSAAHISLNSTHSHQVLCILRPSLLFHGFTKYPCGLLEQGPASDASKLRRPCGNKSVTVGAV